MSALRSVYRYRLPVYFVAIAAVLLGLLLPKIGEGLREAASALTLLGLVLVLACLVASVLVGRRIPAREPVPVLSPVTGRWLALNSPATKVPSHGVRLYGQAHAIDLVYEPDGVDAPVRPELGDGPAMRAATDYPAFGRPVRAMIAGTVVRVVDGQRDHRARSSIGAVFYLLVEGSLRELGGPSRIVGNHIVIDAGDGVFALLAHLRRGSATVRVGDTVAAEDVVGQCGNSGNSSEPHVHAQLMDRPSPWTGQGVPLVFADVRIGDEETARHAIPGNGEHVTAL